MATNASNFASMEDRALLDAAQHLVIEEHLAAATLLRALMEIDTRRLYLAAPLIPNAVAISSLVTSSRHFGQPITPTVAAIVSPCHTRDPDRLSPSEWASRPGTGSCA